MLTSQNVLDSTIELSKVFINNNPDMYYNDPEMLESLLESISSSITKLDSNGYFDTKSK